MTNVDFNEIRIFENYELIESEVGHAVLKTRVTKNSLNLYGHAHGGYLFALCDSMSGFVARSTGVEIVTLTASISYLLGAQEDDELKVEGNIVHNGVTTKVVEIVVTNQNDELVCKGTFTMYVVKNN